MGEKFKAAIDIDKALERPLSDLSAAEFVQVLNHPKVRHAGISLIADKKKYELWVEEGVIEKIPVGVIIEKLRNEKKKVELEPLIDLGQRIYPSDLRRDTEYARLVEDIALRIEERLHRS